jgi:UbiD family decarboxylase
MKGGFTMPYKDLRSFLEVLEKEGEITHIPVEVDWKYEIGAITRRALDVLGEKNKALLYEKPKGYEIPIIANVVGNRKRFYKALDMSPDTFNKEWIKRTRRGVEPKIVNSGPCKENICLGDKVNLLDFPIPLWNERDAGRYITSPCVITKHPETGEMNCGAYRMMVHDERSTSLNIAPFRHARMHMEKAWAKGESFPIAIAIGVDPSIWIVSVAPFPYGVSEFAMASALRREPVELVRCETIPVEVPATAEIILEGEMPPNVFKEEAPFGEYTGYDGGRVRNPVIEIKAITYRNNPIYQASCVGMPPHEDNTMRCILHEAEILSQLSTQPIRKIHMTEGGCGGYFCIASIKKSYEGEGKQVGLAILGAAPPCRWIKTLIIVDEDIDPFNWTQVEWAMSTRFQPDRDLDVISNIAGPGLDPSRPNIDNDLTSKLLIDATKPLSWKGVRFETKPKKDVLEKVIREWDKYGIS